MRTSSRPFGDLVATPDRRPWAASVRFRSCWSARFRSGSLRNQSFSHEQRHEKHEKRKGQDGKSQPADAQAARTKRHELAAARHSRHPEERSEKHGHRERHLGNIRQLVQEQLDYVCKSGGSRGDQACYGEYDIARDENRGESPTPNRNGDIASRKAYLSDRRISANTSGPDRRSFVGRRL